VDLRQLAGLRGERAVRDYRSAVAVIHALASDNRSHSADADSTGVPLALDRHAARPPIKVVAPGIPFASTQAAFGGDDQVRAKVARRFGDVSLEAARAIQACDEVLELDPAHGD
jgi:hypothetical protein